MIQPDSSEPGSRQGALIGQGKEHSLPGVCKCFLLCMIQPDSSEPGSRQGALLGQGQEPRRELHARVLIRPFNNWQPR